MIPIRASLMRGGTSKGLFFLAKDLPQESAARDATLLAAMGSPDERQIDGVGGAHPLTSKVAIVAPSSREDADIDYLFLQVAVDKALVSDSQNCGNLLAGVGPFAIEQGLVTASDNFTDVRIHMVNTGTLATARVQTPKGKVNYEGDAVIDGVPGSAAPVYIDFLDVAGSSCGHLFPSGSAIDCIDGIALTCIDNGMPVVILRARDFGLTGQESPQVLEDNSELKAKLEAIRLKAGVLMELGDVSQKTVPKMTLVSAPVKGGAINTRTFIPHRVHEAIGVLGSVSVATACVADGTIANEYFEQTKQLPDSTVCQIDVEHPSGAFSVEMDVSGRSSIASFCVNRAAILRTTRLLMRGEVMIPTNASQYSDI